MTRARAVPRDPEAGVSLVEILVALAIVGVLSGAAVLALGARGPTAEAEARRLADRIAVALDATLSSEARVALAWSPEGYAFEVFDPAAGAWRVPGTGPLSGRRTPPAGAALDATPGDGRAPIGPEAFIEPLRFAFGDGERPWIVAFDGVAIDVGRGPR